MFAAVLIASVPALAVVASPAAGAAPADPPQQILLPDLGSGSALLVDTAHHRVLVGGAGGLVQVSDEDGSTALVTGTTDSVWAIAETADAETIYVATGTGSIVQFAADDLGAGPTHTYSAAADCIRSIAIAGDGRIWFGAGGCTMRPGILGVLDPSTGTSDTSVMKQVLSRDSLRAPVVVGNAAATPDTLVVSDNGNSTAHGLLATLDVAAGGVTLVSSATDEPGGTSLAVDAAAVYVGRGNRDPERYDLDRLDDSTVRSVVDPGAITPAKRSSVVALSPDGTALAAAVDGAAMTYGALPQSTALIRTCVTYGSVSAVAWSDDTLLIADQTNTGQARLTRCTNATVPQSWFNTQLQPTVLAGASFTIPVQLVNHGAPVPDAAVDITRVDDLGVSHAVGSMTTGTDGRIRYTARLSKVGYETYRFAYAGDGVREPVTAEVPISVEKHFVRITTTAPATAHLDAAVRLTARLVDSSTGSPVTSAAVRIVRHDVAGRHDIGATHTNSTGRLSVVDHPHVGGYLTYDVVFAGTTAFEASTVSRPIKVSRLVPTLSVTLKHPVTGYGGPSVVLVHLSHTAKRVVTVYATPRGGVQRVIAIGRLNNAGNLTVTTHVTKRTVITAAFAGDARYNPARKAATQLAAAGLSFSMTGNSSVSNGVRIFKPGKLFGFVGGLRGHAYNACVRFEGFYVRSGSSHGLGRSGCFRTNNYVAKAYFRADKYGIRGATYYFRAVFLGDSDNVATASAWVRSKIS